MICASCSLKGEGRTYLAGASLLSSTQWGLPPVGTLPQIKLAPVAGRQRSVSRTHRNHRQRFFASAGLRRPRRTVPQAHSGGGRRRRYARRLAAYPQPLPFCACRFGAISVVCGASGACCRGWAAQEPKDLAARALTPRSRSSRIPARPLHRDKLAKSRAHAATGQGKERFCSSCRHIEGRSTTSCILQRARWNP